MLPGSATPNQEHAASVDVILDIRNRTTTTTTKTAAALFDDPFLTSFLDQSPCLQKSANNIHISPKPHTTPPNHPDMLDFWFLQIHPPSHFLPTAIAGTTPIKSMDNTTTASGLFPPGPHDFSNSETVQPSDKKEHHNLGLELGTPPILGNQQEPHYASAVCSPEQRQTRPSEVIRESSKTSVQNTMVPFQKTLKHAADDAACTATANIQQPLGQENLHFDAVVLSSMAGKDGIKPSEHIVSEETKNAIELSYAAMLDVLDRALPTDFSSPSHNQQTFQSDDGCTTEEALRRMFQQHVDDLGSISHDNIASSVRLFPIAEQPESSTNDSEHGQRHGSTPRGVSVVAETTDSSASSSSLSWCVWSREVSDATEFMDSILGLETRTCHSTVVGPEVGHNGDEGWMISTGDWPRLPQLQNQQQEREPSCIRKLTQQQVANMDAVRCWSDESNCMKTDTPVLSGGPWVNARKPGSCPRNPTGGGGGSNSISKLGGKGGRKSNAKAARRTCSAIVSGASLPVRGNPRMDGVAVAKTTTGLGCDAEKKETEGGAGQNMDDGAKQPSRFCHICLRKAERVSMVSCGNGHKGICRKVVCEKCFEAFGWDWDAALASESGWTCTHCRQE